MRLCRSSADISSLVADALVANCRRTQRVGMRLKDKGLDYRASLDPSSFDRNRLKDADIPIKYDELFGVLLNLKG